MWNRCNWCERIILFSSAILLFLLLFNIFMQRVSVNIWLTVYMIGLIVLSVWFTCREIQLLLGQSGPSKHISEKLSKKYRFLRKLSIAFPKINKCFDVELCKADKDTIDIINVAKIGYISSVVERKYIWSWYSQFISKEAGFSFACKELLDQMILKVFQVSSNVDTIRMSSDSLGIILRHYKEYKRALKRLEKSNKGSVEDYYRNVHPTSVQRNSNSTINRGKSTNSHCSTIIRSFLKELLPWELWDTPHAMLLTAILAKRLESFVNNSLSDPAWLRYWIKNVLSIRPDKTNNVICNSDETAVIKSIEKENDVMPSIVIDNDEKIERDDSPSHNVINKTSIESALTNLISNSTAPILQRAEIDDAAKSLQNIIPSNPEAIPKETSGARQITQPIEIAGGSSFSCNGFGSSNPMPNTKNNSAEVKIYDRVIEGSVKTWNNDVDLECISLGHDLLASLDGDLEFDSRIGRLWEADGSDAVEIWSPNAPSTGSSTKTPHGLWFGEEDNLDMELNEESPPKNMVQTNTIPYTNFNLTKPLGIQNMKDLQNISKNTVNQAKNKIGDLQDEAAGVMEGILDLGIAGFRKGLRLTGLQDNQEKSQTPSTVKSTFENQTNNLVASIGQALTISRKNSQSDETAINMDIQKINAAKKDNTEPKPNGNSLLMKQQKVSSQDSLLLSMHKDSEQSIDKNASKPIPIDSIILSEDSPDYEYEEAEDLSSTIAKLRYLLQQKAGEITVPAEEVTKTSPLNNSPMHKQIQIHNPMNSEPSVKLGDIPSMPSLDSENDFTILTQNSADLIEAEDALNHKSMHGGLNVGHGNNMQRLDKLFTRTVTGVFNSIKTAVGGDTLADAVSGHAESATGAADRQTILKTKSNKNNWMFIESDVDMSILISQLLVERRGYCVVEAAQDSLDMLGGTPQNNLRSNASEETIPPVVQDELDETEVINQCPLWHMCMELIIIVMGGITQKDAVVKCTSVALGEKIEEILQSQLTSFGAWLKTSVIKTFHELSNEYEAATSENNESKSEPETYNVDAKELYDTVFEKIPDFIPTLFGKEETADAVKLIISSFDHQLINRDIIFGLLDVLTLYFLKACEARTNSYTATPPPSA